MDNFIEHIQLYYLLNNIYICIYDMPESAHKIVEENLFFVVVLAVFDKHTRAY